MGYFTQIVTVDSSKTRQVTSMHWAVGSIVAVCK